VAVHTSRDLYAAGVQKFYNEAAALARLGHIPSIVKVFDFFYANGTAYIVMEHIEGMPIDQMAKRQGPLDLGLTLTIYYPVMDALAAVHREGLLHRDIAPNNIILDAQYRARLIDFGASRAFSQEISTDMSVILKNGFAPVEQYTRRGRHGPWEDIYALCASIYYTMTGKIPPASTERLVFDTLKPLSAYGQDVPPLFERVIARGMAVRAEERYQSMEELMADVEQLVGPAPAGERTSVPLPEPRPPKAAANWLPAAAAVLGWAALAELGETRQYRQTPAEQVARRIGQSEIVLTNKAVIDRAVMDACPGMRYIGVLSTRYNVVDIEAAQERGIVVTNIPAYYISAVV